VKIRHGFVSNSSSTNFIVVVPKDFKLTIKDLEKDEDILDALYEDEIIDCSDDTEEYIVTQEAVDDLNSHLNVLKKEDGEIYQGDVPAFQAIVEILEKRNFVVMRMDNNFGGGEGLILPFVDQRLKKRK